MSIALPPGVERHVRETLARVVEAAQQAAGATDTDAMKQQLAATWHAVHAAHETIREAERVARDLALTRIEGKAA